jgi:PAS domain S-box-containing protein
MSPPDGFALGPEEFARFVAPVTDTAFVVVDATGVVRAWNAGACLLTGLSAGETVGRSVREFCSCDGCVCVDIDLLMARGPEGMRTTLTTPSAARVPVHVSATPIADGWALCLQRVVVHDVDDPLGQTRRALHDSVQRLRVALAAAEAGVWDWEPSADVLIWSPENYRLHGLEPGREVRFADWAGQVHPDDVPGVLRDLEDTFSGRMAEFRTEFRVRHPDRGVRWLLSLGRLQGDAREQPRRLFGINIDITDRKRAEDALVRHNRVLDLLATGTPLGATLDEVVHLVEAQLPGSVCAVLLVDAGGRLRPIAAPSLPPSFTAALDGAQIGPASGSCGAAAFHGRAITCTDIASDEVWAIPREAALAHDLRSCLSVPILASGNVPGVEAGRVLGTFAVYRSAPGLPDPHAYAIVSGSLAQTDAAVPATTSANALAVAGGAHLARAAIERGLAQEAIRASDERFRVVLDASPAAIYVKDLAGRLQFVNRRLGEVTGIPAPNWIGRTVRDLLPPHVADRFERDDRLVIETRRPYQAEEPMVLPDGRAATFLTLQFPLLRTDGEPYALCGIATDITDRKAVQEERDYLWNNSPDPVCIAGFDGYLHHLNPAWTQRLGWTAEELRARPWLDFVHPDDVEATIAAGARLLRGESVFGFVNRYRTHDGSYRWFSWNSIPFSERRAIYAFIRDVTEEKRLGEQVRQAQKMEAIGQLAGGVAHDFNNLLTVIGGYTALLLADVPAASPMRDPLAAIRDAGDRAATLTAQLLAFSRKAIVEPRIVDLNRAAETSLRLLRRLIGEDIHVQTDFRPALPHIRIDPGQLEQVVMNLVVNARDAMPAGGFLRVSTAERQVTPRVAADPPEVPEGHYVRLTVSDSGAGMSEAVKARVFEPFFTTKGVGKGTGLGLATVYGIVRQAGGTVQVESVAGRGTTFHVLFPAVETRDVPAAAVVTQAPPRGIETVLIVEDEDAVRRFARLALEMQGYAVHDASSAQEVLALDTALLAGVDLLVTDVVMPGTGGRVLADLLRQRFPRMRVLYISGYTDDAVVRSGLETAADAFLLKPFTPEALARKVREVLDTAPRAH